MPDPGDNTQASRTATLRLPMPDLEDCVGVLWRANLPVPPGMLPARCSACGVFPVLAGKRGSGGARRRVRPGRCAGRLPARTPDAQDGRRACRP